MVGLQKLISNYPSLNLISPNFGSAIIFELRNDMQGNFYIQILFKNNNYPGIFLNFDLIAFVYNNFLIKTDPFKAVPMTINGIK